MAGHNYGQGSSREQAALAAVQLGIAAVVAMSFARIHRSNLIAQGIAPLLFTRPEDLEAASVGQTWIIEDVRRAIAEGSQSLRCETDSGRVFELRTDLLERERRTLMAGGTVRLLRAGSEG